MKADLDKYRTKKGVRYIAIYVDIGTQAMKQMEYLKKHNPNIKFFPEHWMDRTIIFAEQEPWNNKKNPLEFDKFKTWLKEPAK